MGRNIFLLITAVICIKSVFGQKGIVEKYKPIFAKFDSLNAKKILILILLVLKVENVLGQSDEIIDSLRNEMKKRPDDFAIQFIFYQKEAENSIDLMPDTLLKYSKKGLLLAQKLNNIEKQMIFYRFISIAESSKGNYFLAKDIVNKGIKLYNSVDQDEVLCDLYHNLGVINYKLQDYESSIYAYNKSKDIALKQRYDLSYVKTNISMASLYVDLKKFNDAIKISNENIKWINLNIPKDKLLLGKAYQNLGFAYWRMGNLDSAMVNINKAYSIHKSINYFNGLINEVGTFAQYNYDKKNYLNAIKYLKESLIYIHKIGLVEGQYRSYFSLVDNYIKMNDLKSAKTYSDSLIMLSEKKNILDINRAKFESLSKLNFAQKNYKLAYIYLQKKDSVLYKIRKSEFIKSAQEFDTKYKTAEKELKIKQQQLQLSAEKNRRNLIFSGFLFLLSVAGVGFYYFKNREKRNALISQNNLLELQLNLNKMEMQNLNQQLNPHEIKNLLFGIAPEIITKAPEAYNQMTNLFNIIKSSLNNEITDTIENQLQQIEAFLQLTKNNISVPFSYQINNSITQTDSKQLPRLMLKNMVENAVKHGIKNNPKGGNIQVELSLKSDFYHITIADNGIANTIFPSTDTGIGLSTYQRLFAILNKKNKHQASLQISSNEQGTFVHIQVPTQYDYN